MTDFLRVDGLVKRFDATLAVDGVSLTLARGEMVALLGPSGSGKTTTLRLLAGFETPDEGTIVVDGEDVTRVEPVARRFGMVFQHYALFPHLDVGGNIAFGLESTDVRGDDLQRRVSQALELVDLGGYERRRVGHLSGGQQQRVALARALAPEPRVLLLDEPLSNLDPTLRERTRKEIRDLIRRVGITTLLVTHEQEEAFDLGDRVAVMRGGRLEQVGTPDELYGAPVNLFVGGFVGRSSTLEVSIVRVGASGTRLRVEQVEWEVDQAQGRSPSRPGHAIMLLRPESLRLSAPGPDVLPATVMSRRFVGPDALFSLRTDLGAVLEVAGHSAAARPGDRVGVVPSRRAGGAIHLFQDGSG